MKYLLALLCLYTGSTLLAQNLVSNPGFEQYDSLPTTTGIFGATVGNHWTAYGPADFFHQKAAVDASIPYNRLGYQKAHSGEAYAGFCITKGTAPEFLHTVLTQPLEAGKQYCIQLFISRGDRSVDQASTLGVYFSPAPPDKKIVRTTQTKPQVFFRNKEGHRDTTNWVRLSNTYTAKGGEQSMTIGCFHRLGIKDVHYYVDDVSVVPIENELTCGNPFDNNVPTKSGTGFILENVLFAHDSHQLFPQSYEELDKLVALMQSKPKLNIEIGGHTDNNGNEAHNQPLSENRAKAVVAYLTSKGIDGKRLSHKGYGSEQPIASNKSSYGRQQNRRVEFKVVE